MINYNIKYIPSLLVNCKYWEKKKTHIYSCTSQHECGRRHLGQLEFDQVDLVERCAHDVFLVGKNIKSEETVETREPETLKRVPAGWDVSAAFVSVLHHNLDACDDDFIGHQIIFNVSILGFYALSTVPCVCALIILIVKWCHLWHLVILWQLIWATIISKTKCQLDILMLHLYCTDG